MGAGFNILRSATACVLGLVMGLGIHQGAAAQTRAAWITQADHANVLAEKEPVALQFRRDLQFKAKPRTFRVLVSADSRFVLYVNGRRVAMGPSRGDLGHWRYEVVDLAHDLHAGSNVVAAEVWNDGAIAPLAQVSSGKVGFFIEAEAASSAEEIDTGPQWSVRVDRSRTAASTRMQLREQNLGGFYAAGATETIDASRQSIGWSAPASTSTDWAPAVPLNGSPFTLVRDTLPQQYMRRIPSGKVVRTAGLAASQFPNRPLTIPANSEASLLIDAGRVLSAYPALTTSNGAGATVSVTYAEALYQRPNSDSAATQPPPAGGNPPPQKRFPDRATVGDGIVLGLTDTFKPDGGLRHRFEPFWWRTWRFVEIRIKTAGQPLTLESFQTSETGYPFVQSGRFVSDDQELNAIWRIGWDTARLDAHETYMDTAYWEQLQYIGDTRIQMMVSYLVSGDPRLAVQALEAFDDSRIVQGIPQSAYPSTTKNPIPPFALLWIGALHDYWMQQPDLSALRRTLGGARSVLDWYAPYLRDGGILRMTPGWLFVDWRPTLSEMNPKNEERPDSCIITLMYYGALKQAAELEDAVGAPANGDQDRQQAARVHDGLMAQCWVPDRGLFADTPAKTSFSQHANILAVLYDLVPKAKQPELMERITKDTGGLDAPEGIIPVTYYFAYYLAEAFDHAGLADRYLMMLEPWRNMVRRHFTAFPENPDPSRSDTHAWSAHPTVGLLTYVAGIRSAAPAFARVHIEPHLGPLKTLDAAMASPRGLIETRYATSSGKTEAIMTLPKGLSGEFVWRARIWPLHSGRNRLSLGQD